MQITPTQLTTIAAALLAVLAEYVPGLKDWYGSLTETYKKLVMLGLLVIVVGVTFGLSCAGWLNAWQCNEVGLRDALYALALAIAANQGTHLLTRRS